tara:strand:- start:2674 stop:4119 length:1446 start_codon:yes stop_codon:yes gene_type:complete
MKFFKLGLVIAGLVMTTHATADTWTPILGIPEPSFGVAEDNPTLPSPWDQEVSGFYYVCPSCSGSSNRSYGTPQQPRNSVPSNPSSGDVIVMAGSFSSGIDVNFNCTAQSPCFMLGDPANRPQITGSSDFGGSYYIVDNLQVAVAPGQYAFSAGVRGSYGAFRNGVISGTPDQGGTVTGGSNIVLFQNEIRDNGDVNASGDQDRHGVKVSGNNIWLIGNEFARNSGDGVQVGDIGTRSSTHHIYIGGNTAHGNKQTGFWVKEAEHVIISQNLSYDHDSSNSSDGEGMGGQYDARYLWFLFNEIRDNRGGIGFKSSNNGGGNNFHVVGNYIHDNINSGYDTGNAWSTSAIASWNGADITIVNNTVTGNTAGINLNGNTGDAYIYNNSIKNMQLGNAQEIFAADQGDVAYENYNAFDGDEVIDTGTAPVAARDPYAIFEATYGISIAYDFDQKSRPIRQWDIGAFEADGTGGVRPNPPVLLND